MDLKRQRGRAIKIIKKTDVLAYEEIIQRLRLCGLQKRRSRLNAIQIYRTAEAVNRANAADTAMLRLWDMQCKYQHDNLKQVKQACL